MASAKQYKSRKFIKNRLGTLIYEISRSFADVIQDGIILERDLQLQKSVLNMNGVCEYCEINEASTKDHFMCLVQNSKPTKYCNDILNLIPCCNSCNSSKGKSSFLEWANNGNGKKNPFHKMNSEKKQRIIEKMTKYKEIFDENHTIKMYNEDKYNACIEKLTIALNECEEMVAEMKENDVLYKKLNVILNEKNMSIV